MDCSMWGFPVHYQLLELAQTHVHQVSDAIQPSHPSVIPFSSCLQSFPASWSFHMSQFFASGGQSIRASASVLPMNIQGWFPLGLTGLISLKLKGLSRVFSNSIVQKHQFFGPSAFFMVIYWTEGLMFLNCGVVLEKTLESPLDFKEIKPVNPRGNQFWIFIRRADVEAEAPILWPPNVKSWIIGKDPDAGNDWRQKEKGMTEDETVGWHHQLNGHEVG